MDTKKFVILFKCIILIFWPMLWLKFDNLTYFLLTFETKRGMEVKAGEIFNRYVSEPFSLIYVERILNWNWPLEFIFFKFQTITPFASQVILFFNSDIFDFHSPYAVLWQKAINDVSACARLILLPQSHYTQLFSPIWDNKIYAIRLLSQHWFY